MEGPVRVGVRATQRQVAGAGQAGLLGAQSAPQWSSRSLLWTLPRWPRGVSALSTWEPNFASGMPMLRSWGPALAAAGWLIQEQVDRVNRAERYQGTPLAHRKQVGEARRPGCTKDQRQISYRRKPAPEKAIETQYAAWPAVRRLGVSEIVSAEVAPGTP